MPLMDGIALAHETASHWPRLPILLMTGFADQRERAQDLANVIRDVVTKPFTLQQIREAVSEAVVDERRGTPARRREQARRDDSPITGSTSATACRASRSDLAMRRPESPRCQVGFVCRRPGWSPTTSDLLRAPAGDQLEHGEE